MNKLLVAAFFAAFSTGAFAQTSVRQSGNVTPKHSVMWNSNGVVQDAGTAARGFLTSIGTTGGGPTICANSADITAPYNRLCFGASTSGPAQITLQNYGGATAQNLQLGVNGVLHELPITQGSAGQCLMSSGSPTSPWTWGACSSGSGSAGGSNTQVQFNSSGSLAGSASLTWVSPILTIGAAGSTTGQLVMSGATSGAGTMTAQAAMGTPTWTLPTGTGTFAVTASSPLVLNATTGALTCPTCSASAGTVTSVAAGTGMSFTTITTTGSVAVDLASNANVWAGTAAKVIDAAVARTAIAPVTVAISTSTFTPDFSAAINLEMTLVHASCPCTIANPTNTYAGLNGFMTIIQSATGSDTIGTWGSTWKFAGGVKPTLSTTGNSIDTLSFYCRTTSFCEVTLNGTAFQ